MDLKRNKVSKRFYNYRRSEMTIRQTEIPADRWTRISDLKRMNLERPVGVIDGDFDILTSFHLRLIREAEYRSKTVIVGVDGDAKIRREKGDCYPVFTWQERATRIVYAGVDWVVEINKESDFVILVNAVKPDFWLRSEKYRNCKRCGIEVPIIYIRDYGIRTEDIIRRIQQWKVK